MSFLAGTGEYVFPRLGSLHNQHGVYRILIYSITSNYLLNPIRRHFHPVGARSGPCKTTSFLRLVVPQPGMDHSLQMFTRYAHLRTERFADL